jgi:ethanolamine utilization cobalamin adenosyltransferase
LLLSCIHIISTANSINEISEQKDFNSDDPNIVLSQNGKNVVVITLDRAQGVYIPFFMEEKPERMTHLFGDVLVEKTHPRIVLRGALDILEAELLLCMLEVPQWESQLGEILQLAREIIRREVLGEPLPDAPLCGLTMEQLRSHSHRPQDFYGQPHFMPAVSDGAGILKLNRVRAIARRAELAAVAAVPDREDILRAMNRMSSALYILMIREKANR